MARMARLVVPGGAHHVTQRGVRRMATFFAVDDERAYLELLAEARTEMGSGLESRIATTTTDAATHRAGTNNRYSLFKT